MAVTAGIVKSFGTHQRVTIDILVPDRGRFEMHYGTKETTAIKV
jgi:hypothetical protein